MQARSGQIDGGNCAIAGQSTRMPPRGKRRARKRLTATLRLFLIAGD